MIGLVWNNNGNQATDNIKRDHIKRSYWPIDFVDYCMLDVGDGQGGAWDEEGGVDLVSPALHLLHQAHLVSLSD